MPSHPFASAHGSSGPLFASQSAQNKKKRKREADDIDGSDGEIEMSGGRSERKTLHGKVVSRAESYASLTANQLEQYRAAGLEPGDDIPKHPFPHRSTSPPGNALLDVTTELRELYPPLVHPDPAAGASFSSTSNGAEGLRERHLGILTTLMHRMLMKGDYQRAGRAWGLLLRSGYSSRAAKRRNGRNTMDVRTSSRWGIGAEVLLGGGTDRTPVTVDETDYPSVPPFSDEGFKKARQYYERLVIQYPEHHRRKDASASSFYAAMFSLWIYEVNAKSKQARSKLEKGKEPSDTSPGLYSSNSNKAPASSHQRRTEAIRQAELQGAREIAERLDEVLLSPPFDKNAELLQLRGMISLWIADLQKDEHYADYTSGLDSAQEFFRRSQANGGRLWRGVEKMVIGDDG